MDSHPEFFKIILAHTLSDKKLSLPPRFLSEYGDLFSTTVLLKLPNDRECRVELTRENGRAWLQNGWQEFAESCSLDVGHFVVFKFDDRDSLFHVSIFDKSGFAIEYPRNYETGFFSKSKNNRVARNKSLKRKIEDCTENSPKERAPKLASRNPYFRVVLYPSHANGHCYLNIPTSFAKTYLKAFGTKHLRMAVLQASDGKKWVSKLYPRSRDLTLQIRIDCKRFIVDNNLEVGDVCVFELIKDVEALFNVFIFRFSKSESSHHCEELESKLNILWPMTDPKNMGCSASRALTASQSYRNLIRNPFFEVSIRSYNFNHGHMNLPAKVKKLVEEAERAKLVLGDRAWVVKLKRHGSSVRFSAGWTAFAKDNCLEVDDVCIFELIDEKDTLFKVSIFRSCN